MATREELRNLAALYGWKISRFSEATCLVFLYRMADGYERGLVLDTSDTVEQLIIEFKYANGRL